MSPVLIRGLSLFEKQGLSPIKLMGRKNQGRTPFFKSQNHAFIKNQMEVSL